MSDLVGYNWARRTNRTGLANSIMRRFNTGRNRMFRPYGGSGIRTRARQRASRSFTQSKRRRKIQSGQGVTDHFDARTIYQKRSMPRRKRKSWQKFRSKVKAVAEKDLGTQQVVFNRLSSLYTNTNGRHIFGDMALYPLASSDFHFNDLKNIGDVIANATGSVTTGLGVGSSSKVLFQSGVLDVTFRNASTRFDGSANVYSSECKLEVDVYEISMRHVGEDATTAYNNLRGLFDTNPNETLPIGGTGVEIDRSLRGVTPFDFSYTLSRYGIKIWKKTKYQLSNNDTFTYQVRDPRRHTCTLNDLRNQAGFNKPGWTRCLLIIAKLAPGLVLGTGTGQYSTNLEIGITRKYTFKVENWSEDRTYYFS